MQEAATTAAGGAWSDVAAAGGERHHMPADSVSPLSREEGPVIRMDRDDHMDTKSWGSGNAAKAYRTKQQELIDQGNFKEAQDMDVKEVQQKFPGKYDAGIQQMLDYTDTIPQEDLLPDPNTDTATPTGNQ